MAEERKVRSKQDDAVSQEAVMALEKENRVAQYVFLCFNYIQVFSVYLTRNYNARCT